MSSKTKPVAKGAKDSRKKMSTKFMKFTGFLKLMLALNASTKEIQTGKTWEL